MANEPPDYRYLNRGGRWRGFSWRGLRLRDDGALQLAAVPRLEGEAPPGLEAAAVPDAPAGIAVDWDGSVYMSDPGRGVILRRSGCDGRLLRLACTGDDGDGSPAPGAPRGLAILPQRRGLVVADSANHRVAILDLETGAELGSLGPGAGSAGQPGSEPGRVDTPWSVAVDRAGSVYVLDYGNRRVQKFHPWGDVDPDFADALQTSGLLTRPADLAVHSEGGEVWVYVLDTDANAVFVFDAAGRPRHDAGGMPLKLDVGAGMQPMGLAAASDAVYIGDNSSRTLLVFDGPHGFAPVGPAFGYRGPIAAIAIDRARRLYVHTGNASARLTLAHDAAFRTGGLLWSGALVAGPDRVSWFRLAGEGAVVPPGAHAQFFVHIADSTQSPPVSPDGDDPFPATHWRPQPLDVTDMHLGDVRARHLWVGVRFTSEGLSTAVLPQLRVEFDHAGYPSFLPAIYRDDSPCGDFLDRLLALFESFFAGTERDIARLAELFDPHAIPGEFLPWLAGWLALDLDGETDEEGRRTAIADAFAAYARRGTPGALRDALRAAGVRAVIQEPILHTGWWALPAHGGCACGGAAHANVRKAAESGGSLLGLSTVLGAAHPQGAVLGSSAILDRTHLVSGDEHGRALFDDVAHQFSVQLYRAELQGDARERVDAVIEREKPAHTVHHVCVVDPRMRVGFQARVGIDTIVAGTPSPTRLGDGAGRLILGGQPRGRVGDQSEIGRTTRV